MTARVRTGVTAWAEPSLLASGWYPPEVRTPAARLSYYATRFSLVENDMPYWAVPDRQKVERWSDETPSDFRMNVKAHALLTGHYTDPERLPHDLRDELPPSVRARPRVYPRHVGRPLLRALETRFMDALAPLHESRKLGVVLFQFPVWFPRSPENESELASLARRFSPYRLAVELRNATWTTQDNLRRTLALFARHDLAFVCVDEPQGFVSSLPPLTAATADIALVRLHGRNAARWDKKTRSAGDRFDYLYSADELREWVPRIHALGERTREVHVLFNNCHADYAVRNASQMIDLYDYSNLSASMGSSRDALRAG